jgi:DNA-binding transcriptional MerR regulator
MSRRHADRHPHHGDDPSYSLDELTSLADVTTRTVRYYITEGLLPPPATIGRNARYTQEHLDRLRLIARLKEEFLPLKEIRTRLQSMTPEEIRDEADEELFEPDRSASRYIASALQERSMPDYRGRPSSRNAHLPGRPDPEQQAWRRIRITDEAELLITESANRRRSAQMDAAIDWIRRILNES